MQRILFFISRCDEKSGLLRQIVNLANGLYNAGNYVEILTLSGERDDLYFPLNDGIVLTSVFGRAKNMTADKENSPHKEKNSAGQTLNNCKNKINCKKISPSKDVFNAVKRLVLHISFIENRRIKKNYGSFFKAANPEIIVVWGARRLSRAWYATRDLKCRIFDAEFNSYEKTFDLSDKHNNRLLKKIDGLIVQTNSEKELFSSYSDRIFVINNPIFENLPMPYIGEREKRIVNFCRLSPQKNLELLIDAFELFHREYPDYVLQIYGDPSVDKKSDVAYQDSLLEIIKQKGLNDSVFIFPARKDIHQEILNSAMFVSSSDYEGLSNSMLEAMAIGLPCVCTDCMGGGTREVMVDYHNGIIVPMNDPKALYRAMKEYVEYPELAEKCVKNAIKIKDRLSPDKIIMQWLEVLNKQQKIDMH